MIFREKNAGLHFDSTKCIMGLQRVYLLSIRKTGGENAGENLYCH